MRKVYLLPNLVTTGNMFCGFYSIVAAVHYRFVIAAWAILLACVFDMLDGRIARMAKATSNFGVEYDSLSDLVSFGVAPAVLMYLWALEPFGRLGWLASFLFMVCGALRLARFNVEAEEGAKNYFLGVPIPVAAGLVATFVIFNNATGFPGWAGAAVTQWTILALGLILASLMISTIPMPSFKELNWRSKASFGYLMVAMLALILIAVRPEVTLFLVGITYLVLSLIWGVTKVLKGDIPRKPILAKTPNK